MKKLFQEQPVSIYNVQKELGLDKNRLYRYADGTIPIGKMPTELILQLSNYFKIEPNELFKKMLIYRR